MATLIFILATYSITLILVEADGPFGVFWRLRNKLEALDCYVCASVYVGAFVSYLTTDTASNWLLYSFGYAGGGIIIYKIGEYFGPQNRP